MSLAAPEVDQLTVTGNAVTIRFDKYMDVSTLQGSVRVEVNGVNEGLYSFPDAEADPKDEAKLYARTVEITLPAALRVDDAVSVTVSTAAKSYAGVTLEKAYSYQETVLDVSSLEAGALELARGQDGYITVIAAPASAASGRIVTVSGDLEALGIPEGTELTLNSFGRASLPVTGQVFGSFHLHFSLIGSELTADTDVFVEAKKLTLVKDSIVLTTELDFARSAALILGEPEISICEINWTSDHPEIVTVKDGVLTAAGGGTATVTGTLQDRSVSCTVHVLDNLEGLQLPAMLTEIEEEAFRDNDSIQYVMLPQNVQEIGDYAFADDDELVLVYIPASVSFFGSNIFIGSNIAAVFVEEGSYAETYCRENMLNYQFAA